MSNENLHFAVQELGIIEGDLEELQLKALAKQTERLRMNILKELESRGEKH